MNSQQLADVMRMIGKRATVTRICEGTGMSRQTILRTLRALEAAKVARICEWNPDESGHDVEPVWALGRAPSTPRRRLTNAEKQRNYRQRKRGFAPMHVARIQPSTQKERAG